MANDSSFATLGLVSIVAVVGVVGLLTQLEGENTTTVVPATDVASSSANTVGQSDWDGFDCNAQAECTMNCVYSWGNYDDCMDHNNCLSDYQCAEVQMGDDESVY